MSSEPKFTRVSIPCGEQILGVLLITMIMGTFITVWIPQLSRNSSSPLDAEKHVMAFYYTWYSNETNYTDLALGVNDIGNFQNWGDSAYLNYTYLNQLGLPQSEAEILSRQVTWDQQASHTADLPAWPQYKSADPAKMKQDFINAANSGIDTLICTWWGPNSLYINQNFNNCLNYAQYLEEKEGYRNLPNFTIYFEHARDSWPVAYGDREDAIAQELIYVIREYGDHPKFFKIDGIPVIFIWATITGGTTVDRWEKIITAVKAEVGPVYFQAAINYGMDEKGLDESQFMIYSRIFDGFHVYLTGGLVNNGSSAPRPQTNLQLYRECLQRAKMMGKNFAICVMPGYDDTAVRTFAKGASIRPRYGSAEYGSRWTYQGMWEDAIAADARWICIVTFNEWWEGTEIDVSYEYGDLFLNQTKYYSDLFRRSE